MLDFSDNGIGFEVSQKDKIFMMFQRLHTHVEGSGMGMFMVKRIVDNTDGKIEVESETGKGTRFRIYLKEQKKN